MMERKHGEYTETLLEKDLMKLTISSPFVVVHFYQKGFRRCEIMDKHLTVRTRFSFPATFAAHPAASRRLQSAISTPSSPKSASKRRRSSLKS